MYRPVRASDLNLQSLSRVTFKLAKQLALDIDRPDASSFIMKWYTQHPKANLFNPLNFKVKSHKPQGKVSIRVLHDAGRSPLGGLAHVIRYILSPCNHDNDYLCFSTGQARDKACSTPIDPQDRLVAADVEDFFMAEKLTHDTLINAACEKFPFLREPLSHLLFHQYVSWKSFKWQVTIGSGMGTQFSSDLCDLTYAAIVESRLLLPSFKTECGIKCYIRYRGDIFIIGSSLQGLQMFFAKTRLLAQSVWNVIADTVSRNECPFLDIKFIKVPGSTRLGFEPYRKPTKIFIPLSPDSAHPPAVHTWPLADIQRIAANSQTKATFNKEVLSYACTLMKYEHSLSVILGTLHTTHTTHLSRDKPSARTTCIIPWHPVWAHAGFMSTAKQVAREHVSLERLFDLIHTTLALLEQLWQKFP